MRTSKIAYFIVCWASCLTVQSTAHSERVSFSEPVLLSGHTLGSSAHAGSAMALYRDQAAVGTEAGVVLLYEREEGAWSFRQHLAADHPGPDDYGATVAMHGNLLAVAAQGDSTAGEEAGAVYVYEQVEGTWIFAAKLTPPAPANHRCLGMAVAVHGDRVLAGAANGSAYLYRKMDGRWMLQGHLQPNGQAPVECEGVSVALENETAVVAVSGDDAAGRPRGGTYVFVEDEGAWVQEALLQTVEGEGVYERGPLVALDRRRLAIAHSVRRLEDWTRASSVHIYQRGPDGWNPTGTLVPLDVEGATSGFGSSVAWLRGWLVVADAGDRSASRSGSVHFLTQRDSGWESQYRLSSPTLLEDGFGGCLAVHGHELLVSAPCASEAGAHAGAVYHYGLQGKSPPVDFDADGIADIGVYHPGSGMWYLSMSTEEFASFRFGYAGTVAVPHDYDGDRLSDPMVYDQNAGRWYAICSGGGFWSGQFGYPGTRAVPADYDGDGRADIGLYDPRSGRWFLLCSTEGFRSQQFGFPGTVPLAADMDADGRADLVVFHAASGRWYMMGSSEGFRATQFGYKGTRPLVADYDGDGWVDLSVYDPECGAWYMLCSEMGFQRKELGGPDFTPVACNFSGKGNCVPGVYGLQCGIWKIDTEAGLLERPFGFCGAQPLR